MQDTTNEEPIKFYKISEKDWLMILTQLKELQGYVAGEGNKSLMLSIREKLFHLDEMSQDDNTPGDTQ